MMLPFVGHIFIQSCRFRSFLNELKECEEEPVEIAKCFINRGDDFQIYAEYVTNYPK